MKITVIGTGYVGLVTGVCLASKGHKVTCVDNNRNIIRTINKSITPIYEKGLDILLKKVIKKKNFIATTNLDKALKNTSLIIIAVGTPSKNNSIDLTYVKKVSQTLGRYIGKTSNFITVVVKSTVTPGTTDTLVCGEIEKFSKKKLGQFGLGMNPEFLREGNAINDFNNPDRIVIGYETDKTLSVMQKLYKSWNVDKILVNSRTAELIKYANNMILATQISAVNEIANLSSAIGGIEIMKVMKGIHLDKRWNPIINGSRSNPQILKYLIPGSGFGGSCFPKDIIALKAEGENLGVDMKITNAIIEINNKQPFQLLKIIKSHLKNLEKKQILILGLAFKPDTDDVRESPAIKIIDDLIKQKFNISAHDPVAIENFKSILNDSSKINFVKDWRGCVGDNDIILLLTNWKEYYSLVNFNLKGKIIIDAKNAFSSKSFKNVTYRSIGTRI